MNKLGYDCLDGAAQLTPR